MTRPTRTALNLMESDMKLSTGREVVESAMPNGATHAEIAGGLEMTESEWEEYCAYVRALNIAQSRARLANRKMGAKS